MPGESHTGPFTKGASQVALVLKTCLPVRGHKRRGLDPWIREALEEGMATVSSVLAWRIPWAEEPMGYSPEGSKDLDTTGAT